jgi:sporulation protein YlmC with PRC-barrel domain
MVLVLLPLGVGTRGAVRRWVDSYNPTLTLRERSMKVQSIAVVAMLFATPALAQTTTPSTSPSASPPAATTAPAGDLKFYTHQASEMRASKLIGTKVRNNANENIGDINELVIDKDGKVAAVVIGVGGFLGIGEREVALDFKSLNIKYDPNAMTESGATIITVNATKDSLKSAPAWTWRTDTNARGSNTAPRTTTTPSGTTR